ncbi:MAG: trypsin-like peptidase domain-containing protein, partial [Actinobacteria bacterium]|nr:trypsin-like peptidase domain-containing protein [Actinomycetota bacterium]
MTSSSDYPDYTANWGQTPYGGALPPQGPAAPPPPLVDTPPSSGGRHYGRAGLGLLALVTAGVVGGTTVAITDHGSGTTSDSSSVASSVNRSGSGVVASDNTTVAGTPESAAAVISPSVVTLEVSGTEVVSSNSFFGQQSQQQQVSDTGSGVVIRVDGATGYILTNNHVVSAAESGGTVNVTLTDGRTVAAAIVGHDRTSDLAVVKVSNVSGLKAATFADSDALKVGQAVLAVGAPLGLSNTVTEGIVSTLHRPVSTGESGASAQSVLDAVQTDAAINPGNSGGALV